MTLLTPTYTELHKSNGQAGPVQHVLAAHEPTKEGEQPRTFAPIGTGGPALVMAAAPLKIALIGTAPSSRMLAPFNDPSWKIWACSPGNQNILPRVDTWFELHSNLLWPEHENYGKPYIEWLKVQPFPVYMQDQTLVPRATVFPKDELVAEFGDSFFTSSFAWMMALAMKMGAAEIALYGIDMASRDEYIQQRPGFFFFRHEARRRGIKVSAPHESDIMQSPALYGYVDSTSFGRKLRARRQEVTTRVNGMTQERDRLNNSITYLNGAIEDIDYMESIWGGVSNDIGRLEFELAQAKGEIAQLKALPPQQVITYQMPTMMIDTAYPPVEIKEVIPEIQAPEPMAMIERSSPVEIKAFIAKVKATPRAAKRLSRNGRSRNSKPA